MDVHACIMVLWVDDARARVCVLGKFIHSICRALTHWRAIWSGPSAEHYLSSVVEEDDNHVSKVTGLHQFSLSCGTLV